MSLAARGALGLVSIAQRVNKRNESLLHVTRSPFGVKLKLFDVQDVVRNIKISTIRKRQVRFDACSELEAPNQAH